MGASVTEITYEKLEDFFNDTIAMNGKFHNKFFNHSNSSVDLKYIFRGESSSKNILVPSALRIENKKGQNLLSDQNDTKKPIKTELEQIRCEDLLLKKFYNRCDYNGLKVPTIERLRFHSLSPNDVLHNLDWLPEDYFELAGLAQHYGIPTRLLDWTTNFFIALYFAISNAKRDTNEYFTVWAFKYSSANNNLLERRVRIIVPEYSQNPNLKAQKGLFTHWQIPMHKSKIENSSVDRRPLNQLIEDELGTNNNDYLKDTFYKLNIPVKYIKDLYFYINTIGFDSSTLFPGYGGITTSIYEDSNLFI